MVRCCVTALALLVAQTLPVRGQIIEDFESYADTGELNAIWLYAELDTATPNSGVGTKSLRRSGEAMYLSGYYSPGSFGEPLDLSDENLGALARRDPASVSPTGFRIEIRDGSSLSCFGPIVEASDTGWHAVNLDPQDSACQSSGIDLTDIEVVRVWVYNREAAKGSFEIAANFDDVAVFLHRDGFESGDFSAWDSVVGAL